MPFTPHPSPLAPHPSSFTLYPSSFFSLGASLAITTIVVKICEGYTHFSMLSLKRYSCRFLKKHPRLQLMTLLFMVIVGSYYPLVGMVTGAIMGAVAALTVETYQYRQLQLRG